MWDSRRTLFQSKVKNKPFYFPFFQKFGTLSKKSIDFYAKGDNKIQYVMDLGVKSNYFALSKEYIISKEEVFFGFNIISLNGTVKVNLKSNLVFNEIDEEELKSKESCLLFWLDNNVKNFHKKIKKDYNWFNIFEDKIKEGIKVINETVPSEGEEIVQELKLRCLKESEVILTPEDIVRLNASGFKLKIDENIISEDKHDYNPMSIFKYGINGKNKKIDCYIDLKYLKNGRFKAKKVTIDTFLNYSNDFLEVKNKFNVDTKQNWEMRDLDIQSKNINFFYDAPSIRFFYDVPKNIFIESIGFQETNGKKSNHFKILDCEGELFFLLKQFGCKSDKSLFKEKSEPYKSENFNLFMDLVEYHNFPLKEASIMFIFSLVKPSDFITFWRENVDVEDKENLSNILSLMSFNFPIITELEREYEEAQDVLKFYEEKGVFN